MPAMSGLGAYTAFFTDQTQKVSLAPDETSIFFPSPPGVVDKLKEEIGKSTLLLPYQAFAAGAGRDDTGPYMALALVHADASSADENVRRIRLRFADGENYPELQQRLNQEMTAENFLAIMQVLEDEDMYQDLDMDVWETSTNDLYAFALGVMDPMARDNLEFQVYDPKQFVEVGYNADQIQRVLDENKLPGTEGYITGYEYIIALPARITSYG